MAKHEFTHDVLNSHMVIVNTAQDEIVRAILKENGHSMGGLIGSVTGANGHYDLESIFFDPDYKYVENEGEKEIDGVPIVCHLNYPAFEIDVNFCYLSVDERQQIVELLIKEEQKNYG